MPTDIDLAYFCIHLGCPMATIKHVFENFAEMCLGECVSVFNFVTLSKYIYEINLKSDYKKSSISDNIFSCAPEITDNEAEVKL